MMLNKSHTLFISVITAMASISLFATDIYLPALPEMASYFHCTQTQIQSSLGIFLLGLAACQLIVGIISDRFGRKKVVMIGLSIFIVASVFCVYATTFTEFIVFRLLQAIGGGVGSVTSRTLVADRFNRQDAVRVFSTMFPIVGLSAAIGPFIGGYLTYFWGWQSTFIFIAGFGVVILVMAYFCLSDKEIHVTRDKLLAPKMVASVAGYLGILRNVEFLGCALIICSSFCVFRCYSIESPFVFSKQGYAPNEMGHFYIALSVAYLVGNLLAKKLINHIDMEKLLSIGIGLFVLGGCAMVGTSLFLEHNPYTVILPMCMICLGNGFLFPVGSAGAMTAVSGELSGMASGLMGAAQCVLAACCISWIGEVCQGEFIPLALFIGVIVLVGFSSYLMLTIYRPKMVLE